MRSCSIVVLAIFDDRFGDLALCDPLPMLCAVINPRNSHIPARANNRAAECRCKLFGQSV